MNESRSVPYVGTSAGVISVADRMNLWLLCRYVSKSGVDNDSQTFWASSELERLQIEPTPEHSAHLDDLVEQWRVEFNELANGAGA